MPEIAVFADFHWTFSLYFVVSHTKTLKNYLWLIKLICGAIPKSACKFSKFPPEKFILHGKSFLGPKKFKSQTWNVNFVF